MIAGGVVLALVLDVFALGCVALSVWYSRRTYTMVKRLRRSQQWALDDAHYWRGCALALVTPDIAEVLSDRAPEPPRGVAALFGSGD